MPLPILLLAIGGAFVGIGGTVHLAEKTGWTPWKDNDFGPSMAALPLQGADFIVKNTYSIGREIVDGVGGPSYDYSKSGWTFIDWSKNPLYNESRPPTYLFDVTIENMSKTLQDAADGRDPATDIPYLEKSLQDLKDLKDKINAQSKKIDLEEPFFNLFSWTSGNNDAGLLTSDERVALSQKIDASIASTSNTPLHKTYAAKTEIDKFKINNTEVAKTLDGLEKITTLVGDSTLASNRPFADYLKLYMADKISGWDDFKNKHVPAMHAELRDIINTKIGAAPDSFEIQKLRTRHDELKTQLETALKINEALGKTGADAILDQYKPNDVNKKAQEADAQKFAARELDLRTNFSAQNALDKIAGVRGTFAANPESSDLEAVAKEIGAIDSAIKSSTAIKDPAKTSAADKQAVEQKLAELNNAVDAEKTRRASDFLADFAATQNLDPAKAKAGLPYLGLYLDRTITDKTGFDKSLDTLRGIDKKIKGLAEDDPNKKILSDLLGTEKPPTKVYAGLFASDAADDLRAKVAADKKAADELARIRGEEWNRDAVDTAKRYTPPALRGVIFGDNPDKGIGPGLGDVGKVISGYGQTTIPAGHKWLKDVSNAKGSYGQMGQDLSHLVLGLLAGAIGVRMMGGTWLGYIAAWTIVPLLALTVLAKTGIITDFTQKGSGGLGRIFGAAAADPIKTGSLGNDIINGQGGTTRMAGGSGMDRLAGASAEKIAHLAQTPDGKHMPTDSVIGTGIALRTQDPRGNVALIRLEEGENGANHIHLSSLHEGVKGHIASSGQTYGHAEACAVHAAMNNDGTFNCRHIPKDRQAAPLISAGMSYNDIKLPEATPA